jgi:EAL domain-containing protein (putative c-di-GMP-specific phosphodiesterase class I)
MGMSRRFTKGRRVSISADVPENLVVTAEELERAMADDEFFLVYQPIMSLVKNRFVGAEALVRWKHPQHGLILPSSFIPVAETSRLIVRLGRWALQSACVQLGEWRTLYPDALDWTMSVNVAARQLDALDFPYIVRAALKSGHLEPSSLRLELTETAPVNGSVALDALFALRTLGVHIDMDDFGTGYAVFACLSQLPVDGFKIDRLFLRDITSNGCHRVIVKTLFDLGRSLGMDVVAEGVETFEQLGLLTHLGCELAQGFYFSPPVSPTECLHKLIEPVSS